MESFTTYLRNHTYVKYLLSYIMIVLILLITFLFIIKNQMIDRFYTQNNKQFEIQLDHTLEWLEKQLDTLTLSSTSLSDATYPILYQYNTDNASNYFIQKELVKYDNSSSLISSIIYKPKDSTYALSTRYLIDYTNNVFFISSTDMSENCRPIAFDPTIYLNARIDQLILLQNETMRLFIYFPVTKSLDKEVYFFILDTEEITQYLSPLLTNEITAIALLDNNRQIIAGINTEQFTPYMDNLQLQDYIYTPDSSNSIYVRSGFKREFYLIALSSAELLSDQINSIFFDAYLLLLLLAVISFFLICYSMKITYLPLKQLSMKFSDNSASSQDYIKNLDSVFSETINKNQILAQKLNHYRSFIRKSLMDTLIIEDSDNKNISAFIDQLFVNNIQKEIFVIQIKSPAKKLPVQSIKEYFQGVLPGKDSCIILDIGADYATFLINYIGTEPHKSEVIKELLLNYYTTEGYLSAISISTDSPLDIPSLYESVRQITVLWPESPVIDCKSTLSGTSSFNYPHFQMEQLSVSLNEQNYIRSRELIDDILASISFTYKQKDKMSSYYINNIFLDILTTLAVTMNKFQIDFNTYEDLYNETLYFCRSCPYEEVADNIETNIFQLIEIYEHEFANKAISLSQVIQFMEENYCDPDFSISLLAEKHHVSIAYMSYLLKKELNSSFSDYRWTLRLGKAQDLLTNTDMSIEEISTALGYLNTTSFHRKFKNETGMTPSQFRSNTRQK